MDKIPTAEEFLKDKFKEIYYNQPESLRSKISESKYVELHVTGRIDGIEQNYPEMMIEFAKLHVRAALKEASEKAEIIDYDEHKQYSPHLDQDSVLNAYPESNIK